MFHLHSEKSLTTKQQQKIYKKQQFSFHPLPPPVLRKGLFVRRFLRAFGGCLLCIACFVGSRLALRRLF